MIVLDASAAVDWLLGRAGADEVAGRLSDPGLTVHAPSILVVEVTAALRGLHLAGHLSHDRALVALADLGATDIALHDPTPLVGRAWAMRANLTAYDAVYVALAEILPATLLTADARLARSPGLRVGVELVGA